tara:strand:+ start:37 stop:1914 length:1878 start_codon:yes stop_codon:yes gene_type:complete
MAKIENTTVYPLTTPSADDFIIGTDTSDDNRTVSFSISTLTAAGGLQGLQSVLDISNVATQDISLTGNITVNGTVAPSTITAGATTGTAGQVLSSTGTGLQWIAAASVSCCSLDDTLTVGNSTTQDINTTGNVAMSGAGTALAFTGGSDITLAAASSITTEDDIILGSASVLNLNATSVINDATGAVGSTGQILTVNALGTGIEWSTGLPAVSMPTLQQVLTAGDTAVGNPMNLTGGSNLTLDSTSNILSEATNTFTATNTFSAIGTTSTTAGIGLTGSLWDGSSTGTASQVLTSTVTGVAWSSISALGVSSVNAATPTISVSPNIPITITPTSGAVVVRQNIYAGGSNIGCVPTSGTASTFLRGDGTWVTPTGSITSVTLGSSVLSGGITDAISVVDTAGAVVVTSNIFGGANRVGHVPDASGATGGTDFLRADGTWATPAGGAASAPEWVQTIGVGTVKVTMTGGDYYMSGIAGAAGVESNTSNWNSNLSTSPPSTAPPSDGQHAMSMVYANSSVTGCTTSYPNHTLCDATIMVSAGYSDTFFVTLWKGPLASHSIYQAVPAATWTEAITATNINATKNMTIATSGTEILEPGFGFFATVRAATGGVQGSWVARIVLKFSGSV